MTKRDRVRYELLMSLQQIRFTLHNNFADPPDWWWETLSEAIAALQSDFDEEPSDEQTPSNADVLGRLLQ